MNRRRMIAACLGALGLVRRPPALWGALVSRYRKLSRPVTVAWREVASVWQPVWFDARVRAPKPSASGSSELLLKGVLLRIPDPRGATRLKAFCLTCPHELCQVGYVREPGQVRLDPAERPEHPLLVCPCHFSIFDPAEDGARLAGPTPRGLYRFRLKAGSRKITITEVEEDALG